MRTKGGLMKNLKYGSRGRDVRDLELFLKEKGYYVIVDRPGREHYGPNLREAVYWYQKNEKLTPDKKFGPACRHSMLNAGMCKYQEIRYDRQTTVIRMNKDNTTARVFNPRAMTLKQMFKTFWSKSLRVVINGTLYDPATMTDLAPLKVNGKDVGGPYYGKKGLKISKVHKPSIGDKADSDFEYAGFSPAVMIKGKVNKIFTNLSSAFVNNRHPRTMVQINKQYINIFIVRGRSWSRGWYGARFVNMVAYAEAWAKYDKSEHQTDSGMFDGGGSTGAYTWMGRVFGWISRRVANGIGFFMEGF